MTRFQIELLDEDGASTETFFVTCETAADAQRARVSPPGCAVFIRQMTCSSSDSELAIEKTAPL